MSSTSCNRTHVLDSVHIEQVMAQSKVHDFDVIVIGAGLSGICFAYRLQERNPHLRYCILEGREEIGGTWSFFQYPGWCIQIAINLHS